MPFTLFTLIFLLAVVFAFYIVNVNLRIYILLLASIAYIAKYDFKSCLWMIIVSLAVFFAALIIQRLLFLDKKKAAKVLVHSIILGCLILFFLFKYSSLIKINAFNSLVIPLGFSYYMFQTISYLTDIYDQKYQAETRLSSFMLYMCYFPKFFSGPIERPDKFLSQITQMKKCKLLDYRRFAEGFMYILYGYFLKTAIADRLGLYLPQIMNNPAGYGSLILFLGMLGYTLQIYCDFAGYTAIAIGVSRLFGINLSQNFNAPYLSCNISEFWKKWHMSLSFWLRDYVYIPLGGSRKGIMRRCLNVMLVFILCGIWHGNGFNFIIWGMLHGIYSIIYALWKKKEHAFVWSKKVLQGIGIAITFLAVSVAWLYFGIENISIANTYIYRMLTFREEAQPLASTFIALGMDKADYALIPMIILLTILDALAVKKKKPVIEAALEIECNCRYFIVYIMIILIFLFGIYGPGYRSADFMYMNF